MSEQALKPETFALDTVSGILEWLDQISNYRKQQLNTARMDGQCSGRELAEMDGMQWAYRRAYWNILHQNPALDNTDQQEPTT